MKIVLKPVNKNSIFTKTYIGGSWLLDQSGSAFGSLFADGAYSFEVPAEDLLGFRLARNK